MCKKFPAPRCKKHAGDALNSAQQRYDAAAKQVATTEEELQAAIESGKAEARIRARLSRTRKEQQGLLEKLQVAQLAADSTPDGQKQIEKLLRAKELTDEERDGLQARLETARAYRVWQQRCAAKLKEFEAKGDAEGALAWAQKEQRAMERKVAQVEKELKAKWVAEQAKKFRNLPPEKQLEVILRKSTRIYYRLNRYRSLYKALTGDLTKLVDRYGNIMERKLRSKVVRSIEKRYAAQDRESMNPLVA